MPNLIHHPDKSWKVDSFEGFDNITKRIEEISGGERILPIESERSGIFYALELTPLDKVKVLIIGQDPYPNPERAQGLAFSFKNNSPADDSLRNMFIKLNEIDNYNYEKTDLTCWAKEGVLLLNTSLTFTNKDSTKVWTKFWKSFIDYILDRLIKEKQETGKPLVIMLWGRPANEIKQVSYKDDERFKNTNIKILRASHPSNNYQACKKAIFKNTEFEAHAFMDGGHNHFRECNEFLVRNGETPINWHTGE